MAAITQEMARSVDEVRQGWIPTSIYSDPAVFQEESRRLFTRTWHFMAHDSEMPNNGDYVVRNLLKDSFIVARGDDAKVRVFLNLCRHRGGQVCRNESGNTRRFMCPYHAWNYKNDGSLVGVPYHEEAYGGEAVLSRKDHGLLPPPRTETFNGLIFINLDPDALPLEEYLGDYAAYLAFYFPPAPRAVEVRGPQRWRFKANWKIGAENFAYYRATNTSDHAITGSAVFNVAPDTAGAYFNKIECFCFTEQTLKPGQSIELPVSFFIDPAIVDDHGMDKLTTITLSYTFYPVDKANSVSSTEKTSTETNLN